MSFTESLYRIANKIRDTRDAIETEEATKNAFVLPFIARVLGYDIFNPSEVIPEFTADVGTKRGEKVDYAVMQDGNVRLLIECKKLGEALTINHASQLFRYFATTPTRIAILTNGQEYQIYTDGDVPNVMDQKPFLVFDLLNLDTTIVPEIQKLSKETFDLESVLSSAEELKYIGQIKRTLAAEIKEPSLEWLRFFIGQVYVGKATQRVVDQFRPLVIKSVNQYLNGQVNDRLQSALGEDSPLTVKDAPPIRRAEVSPEIDSDIVTTEEELDGFKIVRAIAVSEVDVERVTYRDAKSYFSVLLDDNNRKPIIRLHLNSPTTRFVTTFEADKAGTRHDVSTVVDIYKMSELIRSTIKSYEMAENHPAEPESRDRNEKAADQSPSAEPEVYGEHQTPRPYLYTVSDGRRSG